MDAQEGLGSGNHKFDVRVLPVQRVGAVVSGEHNHRGKQGRSAVAVVGVGLLLRVAPSQWLGLAGA